MLSLESLEPKWHWMHFGTSMGPLGNEGIPPRACPNTRMYHVAPGGPQECAQDFSFSSHLRVTDSIPNLLPSAPLAQCQGPLAGDYPTGVFNEVPWVERAVAHEPMN